MKNKLMIKNKFPVIFIKDDLVFNPILQFFTTEEGSYECSEDEFFALCKKYKFRGNIEGITIKMTDLLHTITINNDKVIVDGVETEPEMNEEEN